jgi:hypothetical protein
LLLFRIFRQKEYPSDNFPKVKITLKGTDWFQNKGLLATDSSKAKAIYCRLDKKLTMRVARTQRINNLI